MVGDSSSFEAQPRKGKVGIVVETWRATNFSTIFKELYFTLLNKCYNMIINYLKNQYKNIMFVFYYYNICDMLLNV